VIALENGDVTRCPTAEKLASYAGCTCRVHASGDKLRYGRLRPDVNRYLKWAFIEAANAICVMRRRHPHRHVSRLYERIARRKGHPKAIGRRSSASRRSHVLAPQQTGSVSRAPIVSRFVDRG
jgi:transposase